MFDSPDVTISGNLTGDPELRFTPNGVACANFSVAYTPRRKDAAGNYVDGDTLFLRCTAWRHIAENLANSLGKGDRVIVRGELVQRTWEHEGQKRSAIECQVTDIGASVQYATVKATRAARNNGPAASDPWTGESATLTERPENTAPAGAQA